MEPDLDSTSVSKSDDQNLQPAPSPIAASAASPTGDVPGTANSTKDFTEASETNDCETADNLESPEVPESPPPDPARVSLLKCCEWLEGKLDFQISNNDEENSDIRTAFIDFLSDNTIESMFIYEDRKLSTLIPSFVAMDVPADGQV